MSSMSRRTVAVLATVVVGGALALPSAASAKTVKFKMTEHTKPAAPPDYVVKASGCKVTGTLGTGRCHSKTTPPNSKGGWKLPGGTISYVFKTSLTGTVATGRGHFTGGTGKYKGIKGSFTVRGDITGKFPFTMKGTARF